MKTVFQRIEDINEAFGNVKGDPNGIRWVHIRTQCVNILDEFIELQQALGASVATLGVLKSVRDTLIKSVYPQMPVLEDVRDSLCDIIVFSGGVFHAMGVDADRDMNSVIDSLSSRFVKDEQDLENSLKYHADRGVTLVTVEGDYPRKVLRSMKNQPDAPKGKFLKAASYSRPTFYDVQSTPVGITQLNQPK